MTTFILAHIKNTHIKDADVTTIALKSSTLKTRGIKAKFFGLLTALTVLSVSITVPIAVPTSHAATIYKVVDEKTGQVTFTDRPQNYEQQTDKTVSQTAVSTGRDTIGQVTGEATSSSAPVSTVNSTDNARKEVSYQLMIAEPSETRAYRRPAQSIEVRVQVTIYLDGSEVAQGLSASIATVNIMPGAHNIKAVIQNEKGQLLKEKARTVHVIQNTQTLQNNKKIAQQRLAYQNLPWHQKLLLKLRQKDGSLQTVQNAQPKTNDAFTK
ncbi:DUF4124 domain-containing protein [Psychrobacter sp. A3]|uniref:DUF4124 domain-containing protein n=1 Tax=Psychrobacter sp. A3 TaxID=2992754 RepID=UPI00237B5BA7|nr:DUF4124 domain-containing protein [Psychrobacter sp. A3]MDE0490855.1 DUF4124 domain-containing protein [Psychrobacter sp. A3]